MCFEKHNVDVLAKQGSKAPFIRLLDVAMYLPGVIAVGRDLNVLLLESVETSQL